MSQNLYRAFEEHFPADESKALLETDDGRACTYAQFAEEAGRLARRLVDLGLSPGDRVTVQVEKSPEALFLYAACLRAGLVFQPLNLAYQAHELEYFLENAEPGCVVCRPEDEAKMRDLATRAGVRHVLTLGADGRGSLTEGAGGGDGAFETVPRSGDDLAVILYSSGTTGRPKGIMLSHRNLASNAEALVEAWGFSERDRLLHALPIFHVHGLFVATHCVLFSGASMLFLPRFDARTVIRHLPECTVFMGVPTYYTRLLAGPDFGRETCRNMRLFVAGSAPLLPETFAQFRERTGHEIVERYGMTETGMNTSNPLHGERRPGSVGRPLPGVTVRVAGEDGRILPAGEVGDLQVKGENVFRGYWRMPEKTAEDFTEDGFFKTGDVAVIGEDGYVNLVGRSKDLIITGGLNVYPKEIEEVIDAIDGVREAAVIGVSHPDFGEAVTAVVVREPGGGGAEVTEADVVARVKQTLANFKVPKRVFFVDELPRNTMGKVQKNVLRERYAAEATRA
jgi:malonyl-CoA/methylmalonyl-CoA synthetase